MEIASTLLRGALARVRTDDRRCASCRRTPVPGELMHVFDSGSALCTLCVGEVPAERRGDARAERVRAGNRQLPVRPRAA